MTSYILCAIVSGRGSSNVNILMRLRSRPLGPTGIYIMAQIDIYIRYFARPGAPVNLSASVLNRLL
jgi:hypothetical protein